ncbi:MAG: MarR family winged helix-turn-helix transcriptional regulator [Pseudomonadota bacterium]
MTTREMPDAPSADQSVSLKDVRGWITFRIARLHAKLNEEALQILRENGGLSLMEWRLLLLLHDFGPSPQSILCRASLMDKAMVSRAMRRLQKTGLVREKAGSADMRQRILVPTPKGRALYDRIRPLMLARQTRLDDALSVDERELLMAALEKLDDAVPTRDATL